MRYLLIALLLACASASAQNTGAAPALGDSLKAPDVIDADQKFVEAATQAAGSKEAAAHLELNRAWQQLRQGDIEVAIQSFHHAFLLDPKNVEVFWGLGNAMTQLGKYDVAAHYYARATSIDPTHPILLADAGLSHVYGAYYSTPDPALQAQRIKEAMQWFDKAEKIDPYRAEIFSHRAVAFYLLGEYAEAWSNVDKAEALDRGSVDAKLIAELSAKQPRPESKQPAKPEEIKVKSEAVAPPPAVQAQPSAAPLAPAVPADQQAKPAEPSPERKDELDRIHHENQSTKTEPPSIKLDQDKAYPHLGKDKRDCLKLPTNEEIIRCVYPAK